MVNNTLHSLCIIMFLGIFVSCGKMNDANVQNTFEENTEGWMPQTKLQMELSKEKVHGGQSSLKVAGWAPENIWSYITSPKTRVAPGVHYRLSVWMYVVEGGAMPPFMKVDLWNQDGKNWVKNIQSPIFNVMQKDTWELLVIDFVTPIESDLYVSYSVEKRPFASPVNIKMYIDDVQFETIE